MRVKELVQSIIGSKGFVLEDITIDTEMKLSVRPTKREEGRCGICHRRAPLYPCSAGTSGAYAPLKNEETAVPFLVLATG